MSDWTAGYVADIGYTFGYYTELNPLRARMALLNQGLAAPRFGAACELGFGQGLSVNIHAAAAQAQWFGTDFNPSQAACAQEFSEVSGAEAQLYDDAFEQFAKRDDLPDFDFIGLHGIWSWVSDANRQIIVDFIRRKLKVGGVLYISYNTQPGWAAFAPMRHLMSEHANVIGSEGRGIVSRIDDAIDFANRLVETEPLFSRANPTIKDRIEKLKGQNRHYLAHEYFNQDWHPMHFADMADWLEPAKLSYACSAHFIDHIDAVNLTADQQTFISEIPDAMFRESVRDFMVNQQFRRDYWVKGLRRISRIEQTEQLRKQRVLLVTPRDDVSLKVAGALGEADMSEVVYKPILDYLADHQIRSLADIEQAVRAQDVSFAHVVQAILVLSGVSRIALVQEDEEIDAAKDSCLRLNTHLLKIARGHGEISYLASPVMGGGISVPRFQQLFLLAILEGHKTPDTWADYALQILKSQTQKIIKEGKTLETDEENRAELLREAETFNNKHLKVLRALRIV